MSPSRSKIALVRRTISGTSAIAQGFRRISFFRRACLKHDDAIAPTTRTVAADSGFSPSLVSCTLRYSRSMSTVRIFCS